MREFETYVFDLDGTLLETLKDLAASTNFALRQYDMPEHSIEDVRMFVGNGVKKLMERAIPNRLDNPKFEEVYATFRQHYLNHNLDTTKPYDGIPELLRELKGRGRSWPLSAINSMLPLRTSPVISFQILLKWLSAKGRISEETGPRHRCGGSTPAWCFKGGAVYIGDSDVDIMTARNSGLPCASVLWGSAIRSSSWNTGRRSLPTSQMTFCPTNRQKTIMGN